MTNNFNYGRPAIVTVDCELRRITKGMPVIVVESFAPNNGRNVSLPDGRIVNVSTSELRDWSF